MSDEETRLEKEQGVMEAEADKGLKKELEQHQMLLELGKLIVSEMDMDTLFEVIVNETRRLMETEECSVFMFDKEKNQLWSRVSTDFKKNEIRFPADHG